MLAFPDQNLPLWCIEWKEGGRGGTCAGSPRCKSPHCSLLRPSAGDSCHPEQGAAFTPTPSPAWGQGVRGNVLWEEPRRRQRGCAARCAHSVSAVGISAAARRLSPRVGCVKGLRHGADLLCHPDFGSCYFQFLFGFWKLPFNSLGGRLGGIKARAGADPDQNLRW